MNSPTDKVRVGAARRRLKTIRKAGQDWLELFIEAFREQDWIHLEHASFRANVDAEFPAVPRVTKSGRREVCVRLSAAGPRRAAR